MSTVDSGNLAGHLLTLRQGLLELDRDVLVPARWFVGFTDTLAVLRGETSDEEAPAFALWKTNCKACWWILLPPPQRRERAYNGLWRASTNAVEDAQGTGNASTWLEALERQCTECLTEIDFLAPWHALENPPQRLSPFFDTAFCHDLLELANRDAALVAETRRCQIDDLARRSGNGSSILSRSSASRRMLPGDD